MSDRPTESDTDRDGLFSYPVEIHAFLLGILAVLAEQSRRPKRAIALVAAIALGLTTTTGPLSQVALEPWYAAGGIIAGLSVITLARIMDRITPDPNEEDRHGER